MNRRLAALLPARLIRPARASQTPKIAAIHRTELNPSARAAYLRLERACRETGYYRSRERLAPAGEPVDLDEYFRKAETFLNPRMPAAAPPRIDGPWSAKTRTVTLATWFRAEDALHLDRPTCETLQRARPEALAGTAELLWGVAQAIREGRLRLDDLYGVVVLEGLQGPVLPEKARSMFWRVFQAPVIRQLRGFEGELLAAECECRDGLHIETRNCEWEVEPWSGRLIVTSFANLRHPVMRLRTRLTGELSASRCGCGAETPRLAGVGMRSSRETQRALAAAG
jgi:hypothetical protein